MAGYSQQRARHADALALSAETSELLRPLHDDIASISESFDGAVYFARDRFHKENASAVATVQPESSDQERFAFYKQNIEYRRVDLGATALGEGLRLQNPMFLKSRMNPERHTTLTHRAVIDGRVTGGLQLAFNSDYGTIPNSTQELEKILKKHETTIASVATRFDDLSLEVASIGDVLELDAPATDNSILVSWDTNNSTDLALSRYGKLRNYLLDAKRLTVAAAAPRNVHVHDTGDGQDLTFWLPTIHEGFDRSDKGVVGAFGKVQVLPLLHRLLVIHDELAKEYADIEPKVSIAVGSGYVEHDRHDEYTSQGYWKNARLLKTHPSGRIGFTDHAADIFGIQKTPQ